MLEKTENSIWEKKVVSWKLVMGTFPRGEDIVILPFYIPTLSPRRVEDKERVARKELCKDENKVPPS